MKPRTIIYIDGFNFYYGAVRGTPYKWLDIEKCFLRLRMNDDIRRIWYFTALVDGTNGQDGHDYHPGQLKLPGDLITCHVI